MWTYSGNPASSPKDEVRFLVGDTDSSDPLLTDEEINYILSVSPDQGSQYHNLTAAAMAADAIASQFARLADKTVGSLSIQYSQKYQNYSEMSKNLTTTATSGTFARKPGAPQLGGGGQTYLGGNWP